MTTIEAEAPEVTETEPAAAPPAKRIPRASNREGIAPLKGNPAKTLQQVLFIAGAVLLPGGLVVIGLGWYGVANTPYEYDQTSYLVSGGILGLGITFTGGFLYFGSWLARIAAEQRESADKLSETLLVLAESLSGTQKAGEPEAETHVSPAAQTAPVAPAATVAPAAAPTPTVSRPVPTPARSKDAGATLVVAGRGKTVHRADCDLIAGREDLKPAGADISDLIPCRLCQS